MNETTLSNAIGLLEELIFNGDQGIWPLVNWFRSEEKLIIDTLNELRAEEAKNV